MLYHFIDKVHVCFPVPCNLRRHCKEIYEDLDFSQCLIALTQSGFRLFQTFIKDTGEGNSHKLLQQLIESQPRICGEIPFEFKIDEIEYRTVLAKALWERPEMCQEQIITMCFYLAVMQLPYHRRRTEGNWKWLIKAKGLIAEKSGVSS